MISGNLYENIPEGLEEEFFEIILERGSLKLERIVSHGQTTPDGQWYDQEWDEWVVVLRGRAEILFDDEEQPRVLEPGHYVHIPAGRRHRVVWTDPEQDTIWLALHHR
jgi:cupin 2 domain-containing protein